MRGVRKISSGIALIVIVATLSYCDGGRDLGEDLVRDEVLILVKTLDNPFFNSIVTGASSVFDQYVGVAVDVRGGEYENDAESQARILDTYILSSSNSLKGVLLTPSGSGSEVVTQIARLNANNIPVILIDTNIEDSALNSEQATYSYFIGSDNRLGGQIAGNYLNELLDDGAEILVLNGPNNHETAQERREGFFEAIEGKGFSVSERTANWREVEARAIVSGLIVGQYHFDAIFAANDNMALGAIEAYRTQGRDEQLPLVVGFDAIDEAVESVESGIMAATIRQQPEEMGRQAATLLMEMDVSVNKKRTQINVPLELISQ